MEFGTNSLDCSDETIVEYSMVLMKTLGSIGPLDLMGVLGPMLPIRLLALLGPIGP